ncbi:MAG: dihydroneopterin aldolase [Chloroflexi bacterium]|nr:dihydroneopterin aldolase [Chloroflexota bacterium]
MTDDAFPDRLSLMDMRFEGRHGAVEGEQDDPQPFEVDVILHADLSLPADGDELATTVDYRVIAELARSVVEGPSVILIETLAGDIAREVLDATDPALVDAVEVSVRKPQATLDVELEAVEASLLRRRSSAPGSRSVTRRAARPV